MTTWLRPIVIPAGNIPANIALLSSLGVPTYLDTKWSMESLGDSPVKTVTRSSLILATFRDIFVPTMLELEVMLVPSVARPLPPPLGSSNIRISIVPWSPSDAKFVSKVTPNFLTYAVTRGCMPTVECKSNVTSVNKPSLLSLHFLNTGGSATPLHLTERLGALLLGQEALSRVPHWKMDPCSLIPHLKPPQPY